MQSWKQPLVTLLLSFAVTLPATAQENGDDGVSSLPVFKGPFPDTRNMVFHSQIAPEALGAMPLPGVWSKGMVNDIWGYTSPAGEEYALVTHTGGISVVRITTPEDPVYLGTIGSQLPFDSANIWGDGGTFGHFAYFVTEIDDSSVVIVDLENIDAVDAAGTPGAPLDETLVPVKTFNGGGYHGAHNIFINQDSGFAYLAGVHLEEGTTNNACGAVDPPRFNTLILDLNADPWNPTVAACREDVGEHDFYVVNYEGPDSDYQGSEIAFVFDGRDRQGQREGNPVGGFTEIWDVTDKSDIQVIDRFRVPELVFSHNGWTTEAQDFLFIGDEIDELVKAGWMFGDAFGEPVDDPTNKPRTGTYIMDITDLDDPELVERFEDETVGLDHNFAVKDGKLFIASYTSGTRVLNITRDAEGTVSLEPYAHMDTEPRLPNRILNINQEETFGNAFLGQWGIFPLFDSGTVIATDINNGLIVMSLSDTPCKGMKCSRNKNNGNQ